MSPIVIDLAEINAEVNNHTPCGKCSSSFGVVIESDFEWSVVVLHDPDCDRSGTRSRLLSIPGGVAS